MSNYKVGIVGATGAVGQEMLQVLQSRNFPLAEVQLFASERSAGKTLKTPFGKKKIQPFSVEAASQMDFVLLAVSGDFARDFAKKLTKKTIVIDNSSAFRNHKKIPLVVPEVNAQAIQQAKLIANPNCTTAILAVALYPLFRKFGLRKLIVSTYQAVSGAGAKGIQELKQATQEALAGKKVTQAVFPYPIAFNLLPQIDTFQPNGYTREEMKVVLETRKIFAAPDLPISCTAVRVPTFRAHAEAVTIETQKPLSAKVAREVLAQAAGVKITDDPVKLIYPQPRTATQNFAIEVGRLRQSLVFGKHGLDFFICGDQLLKGAALNAVQILEEIIKC